MVEPVRGDIADVFHGRADDPLRRWAEGRAVLRSDNAPLERTIRQSRDDLTALRLDLEVRGQRILLPGAGLPWFLTVFGRDTLITRTRRLSRGPRWRRARCWHWPASRATRVTTSPTRSPARSCTRYAVAS
ncbi:hypothetical protein FHG89_03210 [Micromonospora orduensis]|uniref:Uncharacterized protein n=1 Tax=Micromonospora orduensis TaxID=1420891 RepID=A0A5C4QZ53_9ACTN|nr:hypothetical protein FHG89_03210 [Micromonospora orduensis]